MARQHRPPRQLALPVTPANLWWLKRDLPLGVSYSTVAVAFKQSKQPADSTRRDHVFLVQPPTVVIEKHWDKFGWKSLAQRPPANYDAAFHEMVRCAALPTDAPEWESVLKPLKPCQAGARHHKFDFKFLGWKSVDKEALKEAGGSRGAVALGGAGGRGGGGGRAGGGRRPQSRGGGGARAAAEPASRSPRRRRAAFCRRPPRRRPRQLRRRCRWWGSDRMLKQLGDAIQRLDKAHADERLVLRENAKLKLETQRLKGELDHARGAQARPRGGRRGRLEAAARAARAATRARERVEGGGEWGRARGQARRTLGRAARRETEPGFALNDAQHYRHGRRDVGCVDWAHGRLLDGGVLLRVDAGVESADWRDGVPLARGLRTRQSRVRHLGRAVHGDRDRRGAAVAGARRAPRARRARLVDQRRLGGGVAARGLGRAV